MPQGNPTKSEQGSGNIAVRAVKGEGTLDVQFRREKISATRSN